MLIIFLCRSHRIIHTLLNFRSLHLFLLITVCVCHLLISAPRGVYYFLSLTLSVCPDVCPFVCHAPLNRFFFFVSRWNRVIFWRSVLQVALYKALFLDFWFRPPNAQSLLSKICTKSPISRFVWQIDRICLSLLGGFRDGRFNETMQNVVGPTLVAMATTFGLGAEI